MSEQQQMQQTSKYEGHTPGPWRIGYGAHEQDEYFTVVSRDHVAVADFSVANHHDEPMPHAEMVANANLIADAPALLARAERAEAQRDELLDALRDLHSSAVHSEAYYAARDAALQLLKEHGA